MAFDLQSLIVGAAVLCSAAYTGWSLMPARWRQRCMARLGRASSSGSGCGGCSGCATPRPPAGATQPLRFVPRQPGP